MTKYDIGFGPLNGPREATGGLGAGPATTTLKDGQTDDAPRPTNATLAIPNLQITATPYLGVHKHLEARAVVTWDPPTAGESDTEVNQVKSYEIHYSTGSGYGPLAGTVTRNVTITGLPVLRQLVVQVRAKCGSGVLGPFATASIITPDTTTAPPVPSAPTVLGTMRGGAAQWDGLFAGGVQPPDNLQYIEAQLSLAADFSNSKTAVLSGPGTTAVVELGYAPFTIYARLRAMNTSGVFSGYSAAASGGSIPIIPADVGQKAITTAKLNDAAVTAQQILNGAIDSFKLADGAVTGLKLADLSVAVGKIVDGAISAAKLGDNAVTRAKILDGAVGPRQAALAAIDPNSGTLAINSVFANNIVADQVNANHIVASAITTSELSADSVTAGKIAANNITAVAIATDAIIARHVVAGEIYADKLATDSVTTRAIAALSITVDELGANSVQAGKIAANAVSAGTIQAGVVVSDTISGNQITGKTFVGSTFATGALYDFFFGNGQDRVEMLAADGLRDAIRWYRGYDNFIKAELRGYMGDIGAEGLHINSDVEIGNLQSTIFQVGRRNITNANSRVRAGVSTVTAPAGGSGRVTWSPAFPAGAIPRVTAISEFAGANAVVLEIGSVDNTGFSVAFGGPVVGTVPLQHVAATRDVHWNAEWYV